ncbi:PAS domain S-box protein [Marispirochaeta sp.]|jgi:two-component system, LuxR family, sensor kinase FixL|uniref:PAS domain S-box protein n=1 Tax=Marispirochaeta sp. TaxID=2038653 RepID=UPI0029C9748F|nr:PAS domain S-box protein [Marispirochaeta sp.]
MPEYQESLEISSRTDPPRILVVEDEAIVAIDICNILNSLGYIVLDTVDNGSEVIDQVNCQKPDLILMDIHLKGELDGIEVAEIIHRTHRIPVIYISAYSDVDTLSRAKTTQPYGYIIKSFDQNDLFFAIEMALYRHDMEIKMMESERLLATTFGGISDGVISCTADGKIQLINIAACRMLGLSQDDYTGRSIRHLPIQIENYFKETPPDPLDFSSYYSDGKVSGRYFIVVKMSRFPVVCTVSTLKNENEKVSGYIVILRNIEEEYQVQEMQSRLASIVETSEDAIIGSTPEGTIISWNRGARILFGYTQSEVQGKNLSILVPDFYPNEIPEMLDRIRNGEVIDHYETLRTRKDGGILDMSIKISPIRDSRGHLIAASLIARDMSKRKQLEKEILEIEDRERSRIGQDLHDSLGQQLTGILLRLKALEGQLLKSREEENVHTSREIQQLVRNAVEQTREMAKGLIPVTLQTDGLVEALQELTLYCQSMYGVATTFDGPREEIKLQPIAEVQLYHICQEALTNAIKHSLGTSIMVSLERETTELVLSIHDNGNGITEENSEGLGLRIMQYRANMVGGHLSIIGNKGWGTAVICRVPITQE